MLEKISFRLHINLCIFQIMCAESFKNSKPERFERMCEEAPEPSISNVDNHVLSNHHRHPCNGEERLSPDVSSIIELPKARKRDRCDLENIRSVCYLFLL